MTSESEDTRFLPGRHQLEAYGNGGFRFGGMSHRGSVLALPSGVRAWPVRSVSEIGEAALAPIIMWVFPHMASLTVPVSV